LICVICQTAEPGRKATRKSPTCPSISLFFTGRMRSITVTITDVMLRTPATELASAEGLREENEARAERRKPSASSARAWSLRFQFLVCGLFMPPF